MRIAVERPRDPEDEYERIGRPFKSQFSGECAIDYRHPIKRNDVVSKIAFSDNPLLPVQGVACKNCTKSLKHADA